ncbi:BTAD domain-containing putative transcriptional regulator [Streptomyces sp. NBC_00572]|uniref:AfsR/SARP family transcriptional regulator n=1 Tax=Streptomyces sp. NBC_00572 TaxID=2903664 RepID=UPI002253FA2E|nr:BTAD domain-containing putative transcriptional regulator [Streptomyces sp. NBC_00572]MCX4986406.1 tetratricopeptide repeat protein [Streptomyces sp. NBC_00572]
MVVKFGLLGSLVVHDGTELRPVTGPKVRVLLAALLLQANRAVSRDALKEALWGASVPASADAALANHLTRLRRVLAALDDGTDERLRTVAPGYQLLVDEGELDADLFEARVRAVRHAHRREDWEEVRRETALAMPLWRGTPLADLAPFADTEGPALRVHQLAEARLQALEWSFDAELGLGRHHEAVAPLSTLAAEHPLREGFHRRLMLALYRSGRQAEAFSVYHRLRRSLVEELGTEPSAAVQRAHQEVLAGEPAPHPRAHTRLAAPRPPFQLPCEGDAFTGREAEAAAIRALLGGAEKTGTGAGEGEGAGGGTDGGTAGRTGGDVDGRDGGETDRADGRPDELPAPGGPAAAAPARIRPVVISGMGGVGKTALAVHVAHRLREAFPDGALYADLRGYCVHGARTAHELLARFLSDLGVHHDSLPDDTDDRALLLRAALAERRVLLVLDNARNADHVAPLLPAGGPSAALITSRQLLADLPGSVRVPLAPLPAADQHALLAKLAGADRVRHEPEALADIMAACGGLPLALHIVGGRLASRPSWPLALLAKRLTPHQGRLETLTMGTFDVQRTFAMSYVAMRDSDQPLEREAARAFRLLGRAWSGHQVTPQSTAALLDVTEPRAAAVLDVLADAHLVLNPEPDRYVLHDLLGEYAWQRGEEEDTEAELLAATLRLLSWYVTALAAASRAATRETQSPPPLERETGKPLSLPEFADDDEAIRWTARELPAIRDALTLAGELGRSGMAWRLAVGLFGYAGTHWWTSEWDTCLGQAMDIARAHDDTLGQAWLHRRMAVAHGMAYRNEACLAHLRIALELFTARGDVLARASILGNLSSLYSQIEDAEQALAYAEASRDLYREAGNTRGEALVLSRIADARQLLGDFEQAAADMLRVVELLRADGHWLFLATSLTKYGDIQRGLGRRDEAFAALAEALGIRHRMEDAGGTADCLVFTARAHHHFGEWDVARATWETCLELARTHNLAKRIDESLEGLAALPDAE